MASIQRYRDGWRVQIQRHGQRASKTFATKRAAQEWALLQEATGDRLKDGWRTFAEASEEYLARVSVHKRGQRWEFNTLARLGDQLGADAPLGEIDEARIAAWRDQRLKTVSGSTVQREANLLRNLFAVARKEWKWISHSPFDGVKLPKHNPPRKALWTWPLIRRVLRAPRTGKTAQTQRAFRIALHTGMRLSEVLGARLAGRVAVLARDKTTDDEVRVPLARKGARLLAGEAFSVGADEASTLFRELLSDLGITGLTFHDSRASALTWLSRRVDVLTLSRISRHKNIRILQAVYYRETAEQVAARL